MGADLPANQRVVGINMVTFEAEDLLQMANERFADLGHRCRPLASRLHRGIPQRRFADPRFLQHVVSFEIGTDIQSETMVGDPAIDRHADRGYPRLTGKHPRQVGPDRAMEIEFLQDRQNRRVQSIEVVVEGQSEGVQRQSEVGGKLAGKVEHAATAAIDPMHPDSHGTKRFIVEPDVGTAAGTAHADCRLVLAENQGRSALFPEIVNDAALELLDLREVNQPQHVHFNGRLFSGSPHRLSMDRQKIG
jgi:hypothetical protein